MTMQMSETSRTTPGGDIVRNMVNCFLVRHPHSAYMDHDFVHEEICWYFFYGQQRV